jgi:hypothetical protein
MQQSVKERIAKLREEIAQIREANRLYLQGGKRKPGTAGDQERRLQRLQEIQDELISLTIGRRHEHFSRHVLRALEIECKTLTPEINRDNEISMRMI